MRMTRLVQTDKYLALLLTALILGLPYVALSQEKVKDKIADSLNLHSPQSLHAKHNGITAVSIPIETVKKTGKFASKHSFNAIAGIRNAITDAEAAVLPSQGASNQPLYPESKRVDIAFDKTKEPMIILAVSGGGSRAAYYTACVFEQLAQTPDPLTPNESILDRVKVISAVSGGSLASAYYTMNFDKRHDANFYALFKDKMARNYSARLFGKMTLWPPTTTQIVATEKTRTDVLGDILGSVLGKNKTFNDLQNQYVQAPENRKPPILVLNGTVWNTGTRIVMTNLPSQRFPATVNKKMLNDEMIRPRSYKETNNILKPLHFETFGSDIGTFRLSKAVACSMAYPIWLSPMSLKVYPDNIPPEQQGILPDRVRNSRWIQVCDGGVFANDGIDSVLSLVKTMPQNTPVMVIYIHGGFGLEPMASTRDRIWGVSSVINRMYDIGNSRPMPFYLNMVSELHNKDKIVMLPISLGGYTPKQTLRLFEIPTALRLSPFNRNRIDAVASQNVHDIIPGINEGLLMLGGKKSPEATKRAIRGVLQNMQARRAEPEV